MNDNAVTPIIGVILMVAITIILAAVIAAFIFGMAANVEKAHTNGCVYEKTAIITYQRTGMLEEDYFTTPDGCKYLIPYGGYLISTFKPLSGHNITFTYDSTNHVVALICDHGFVNCCPTPTCTPVPKTDCGCGS